MDERGLFICLFGYYQHVFRLWKFWPKVIGLFGRWPDVVQLNFFQLEESLLKQCFDKEQVKCWKLSRGTIWNLINFVCILWCFGWKIIMNIFILTFCLCFNLTNLTLEWIRHSSSILIGEKDIINEIVCYLSFRYIYNVAQNVYNVMHILLNLSWLMSW